VTAEGLTNGQLLKWMFGFVRPVKPLVVLCTAYLLLVVTWISGVRSVHGAPAS
jgi:hypothetical protein